MRALLPLFFYACAWTTTLPTPITRFHPLLVELRSFRCRRCRRQFQHTVLSLLVVVYAWRNALWDSAINAWHCQRLSWQHTVRVTRTVVRRVLYIYKYIYVHRETTRKAPDMYLRNALEHESNSSNQSFVYVYVQLLVCVCVCKYINILRSLIYLYVIYILW